MGNAIERKAKEKAVRLVLMAAAVGAASVALAVLLLAGLPRQWAWMLPAGIGLGLLAVGAHKLARARTVRDWLRAPARIAAASVEQVYVGGATHIEYRPQVSFRYSWADREYESQRLTIANEDFRHHERQRAERLLAEYPVGAEHSAFVDPGNHAFAVLRANISAHRRSHYLALCVAGVLLMAVSAGLAHLLAG
jgi:Protein of unknown function (DUF3592)